MTGLYRTARPAPFVSGRYGTALAFACCATMLISSDASAQMRDARRGFIVTDFSTVRIEAPVAVDIVTGKGPSATGTGDRAMLDRLAISVNSGTLRVTLRAPSGFAATDDGAAGSTGNARLTITTGTVSSMMLLGPGSIKIDRMRGERADINLRGSGSIFVGRIDAAEIVAGLRGSGSMTLAGTAGDFIARTEGAGRIDAGSITARRAQIDSDGSAELTVTANETATINAAGSGRVAVRGKAQCTVRRTGSVSVTCGN